MGQPILISNLSKLKAESQTGNIEAQITYMFKRVYDSSGSATDTLYIDLFEQHKIFEAMYYVWNVGFTYRRVSAFINKSKRKRKKFRHPYISRSNRKKSNYFGICP